MFAYLVCDCFVVGCFDNVFLLVRLVCVLLSNGFLVD